MSELHTRHAFTEIARHILAAGGAVAYSGEVDAGGYARILFDLAETYDPQGSPATDRVVDYLSWHIYRALGVDDEAALIDVATLVGVPPPPMIAIDDPDLASLDKNTPAARWKRAHCLRSMRDRMTTETTCRVILGGATITRRGVIYQGILEEAVMTVRAAKPLYVVGGLGGAAHLVARTLMGETPREFSIEGQIEVKPDYIEIVEEASHRGELVNFEALLEPLRETGYTGLCNGLGESDNSRLAHSEDVDEIVALILRGMHEVERMSS